MKFTTIPLEHELPSGCLENTQMLIRELRSGKWNQGTYLLKSIGSTGVIEHCCLGVGSEIQGVPHTKPVHDACSMFVYPGGIGGVESFPDIEWWKSAYGWNPDNSLLSTTLLDGYLLHVKIVHLNDGTALSEFDLKPQSFTTIADIFESCFVKREAVEYELETEEKT